MNIKLRKQTEDLIKEKVDSGQYPSAADFVEAAIMTHLDQELSDEQLLEMIPDLKEKIAEARASGPPIPAEEVFAKMYERQREIEKEAQR